MAITIAHAQPTRVTVGVDTHGDVHVAHAKDQLGRRLDTVSIPTTPTGYRALLAWARGLGQVQAWGVEGTGSYGAGLARYLRQAGQVVLEVNRPDRAARRRRAKSDPVDAEAAARAVQAGEVTIVPRPPTATSRCCARCGSPAPPPCGPAPRRSTPSARCWSPHPPSCASSCGACPRSACSRWPPRLIRAG
jgi:transposase